MSWLSTSIMARKGVAKGVEGARHKITIEDQGTFHYVYGPYADPVLEVEPGAVGSTTGERSCYLPQAGIDRQNATCAGNSSESHRGSNTSVCLPNIVVSGTSISIRSRNASSRQSNRPSRIVRAA